MKVERTAATTFTAELESEDELRNEHRTNLTHGALLLPTAEKVALYSTLLVTLRGPWGGETEVKATAAALLPNGLALSLEGYTDEHLERLLAQPAATEEDDAPEDDASETDSVHKRLNTWDRIRDLPQMQKILLGVKADRTERAFLLQDSDPRVLLSLLRNPRLTVDEVARLAKSSHLTFQIADEIMKAGQWSANLDVRLGLIHNPKTPQAFALRILPTLPENEVRSIARAGTSMALKQAALRQLQSKV